MAQAHIFVSYNHSEASTIIVREFESMLKCYQQGCGYSYYIDTQGEAGEQLNAEIEEHLNRTTHFIAFLTPAYFGSDWCKKELFQAINLRESQGWPRLLFVEAQTIQKDWIKFDEQRRSGILISQDPLFDNLGQMRFLGPYHPSNNLSERLAWDNLPRLTDQLDKLCESLGKILEQDKDKIPSTPANG